MAQRKLKIGLATNLANMAANATILLDGVELQNNIAITHTENDPLMLEYTFEANATNELKIIFNNDFCDDSTDLNMLVTSVALSNEDLTFTEGQYLTTGTYTAWGPGEPFELTIAL